MITKMEALSIRTVAVKYDNPKLQACRGSYCYMTERERGICIYIYREREMYNCIHYYIMLHY